MKVVRVGLVVALLVAVGAFVGVGLPEAAKGSADEPGHSITVNGTGTASTVPDRATFTFGVDTKRKMAVDAAEANNRDMRELIDGLKNAGVPKEDIADVSDLFSTRPTPTRSPRSPGTRPRTRSR